MQQFTTGDSGWIEKQVLSWREFFGLSDNPAMSCHPVCRQVTKSSCLFSWRLAALKKSSWPNWSKLTMIGRPRGLDWVFPATRTSIAQSEDNCREFQGKFQHRLPSSMLANFSKACKLPNPALSVFAPSQKAEPAAARMQDSTPWDQKLWAFKKWQMNNRLWGR